VARYFTLVKNSRNDRCYEFATFRASLLRLTKSPEDFTYTANDYLWIQHAFKTLKTRKEALEYLLKVFNGNNTKTQLAMLVYAKLAGFYVKYGAICGGDKKVSFEEFNTVAVKLVADAPNEMMTKLMGEE